MKLAENFAELDQEVFSLLSKFGYQPEVIFDVGASNGVWSNQISKVFPEAKYHLFEPLVDYFDDYQSIMKNMLAAHPTFTLHRCAVGETTGEIEMNAFPNRVGSTALEIANNNPEVIKVPVQIWSLDDAINALPLPVPQVIKIDTQGCELSILKGATQTLPNVDVLLLECWLYRGYGQNTPLFDEIINWLLPYHFRLWDIVGSYRNPDGVLAAMDGVFVNVNSFAKSYPELVKPWYYPQADQ